MESKEIYSFVKGAPEVYWYLFNIFRRFYQTYVNQYRWTLNKLTKVIFRMVLGWLPQLLKKSIVMFLKLYRWREIYLNKKWFFWGKDNVYINMRLCIFENPLKPESSEAILKLKEADIKCKIVTGDN